MATYRKTGKRWRAEVSKGGVRTSKVLKTKAEALAWAEQTEAAIDAGRNPQRVRQQFRDILIRYRDTMSPDKKGARWEELRINAFLRDEMASVPLGVLDADHIAAWRDRRVKEVSGSTVVREMHLLSAICSTARKEWRLLDHNPCSDVKRPKENPPRTRLPTLNEIGAIVHCLGYEARLRPTKTIQRVACAYLFALESGLRAGELAGLEWGDVHDRHVHVVPRKTDYARDVPLSAEACRILQQLHPVTGDLERVFNLNEASIDALFRKARNQACVEGLTFHDSRAYALTQLAKKVDPLVLAKISGHRDLKKVLNVYYRPSVDELADAIR